jgi:hypothetical protein
MVLRRPALLEIVEFLEQAVESFPLYLSSQ